MSLKDKIINYEKFLPDEMFDEIEPYLTRQSRWSINRSDPKYHSHKIFWGMRLEEEKLFSEDIFKLIEKKTQKRFEIIQILANAQSTLQDGSPHIDSVEPEARTFILYANRDWDYLWGGQTIFFDRHRVLDKEKKQLTDVINSSEVLNIFPIPNTAVLFHSNILHYAAGPSRDFYGIQFSVAYHLKEI